MRIVVVVGNPKPNSRTRLVAERLAAHLCARSDGHHDLTVELADHASQMFAWPNDELLELVTQVTSADVLVVASPTYKATYTGLLKSFLDRFSTGGLQGTTAIPLMTADDPLHGLAVEVSLRPVLTELGASIPGRGMFVHTPRIGDVDALADEWIAQNPAVLQHVRQSDRVGDRRLDDSTARPRRTRQ